MITQLSQLSALPWVFGHLPQGDTSSFKVCVLLLCRECRMNRKSGFGLRGRRSSSANAFTPRSFIPRRSSSFGDLRSSGGASLASGPGSKHSNLRGNRGSIGRYVETSPFQKCSSTNLCQDSAETTVCFLVGHFCLHCHATESLLYSTGGGFFLARSSAYWHYSVQGKHPPPPSSYTTGTKGTNEISRQIKKKKQQSTTIKKSSPGTSSSTYYPSTSCLFPPR